MILKRVKIGTEGVTVPQGKYWYLDSTRGFEGSGSNPVLKITITFVDGGFREDISYGSNSTQSIRYVPEGTVITPYIAANQNQEGLNAVLIYFEFDNN